MRTVIIAEKEHIEAITKYRLFLDPFLRDDITFCEWNTEGQTIQEMVPSIKKRIGGEREWKAVLLFDDLDARKKLNPFDVVNVEVKEDPEAEDHTETDKHKSYNQIVDDCLARLTKQSEQKIECYNQAAKQPLTRLVTFLCAAPLDSNGAARQPEKEIIDEETLIRETNQDKADRELRMLIEKKRLGVDNAYRLSANRKKELRAEIVGDKSLEMVLPTEVYCISLRSIPDTRETDEKRLNLAWDSHNAVQYSDFGDRNMYFEHMRYFVYDILPDYHVNYQFNYLEFLYTLLVFASNRIPSNAVQPNRLYCIESDCSEERLKALVLKYNQKLENTISLIKQKEKEILMQVPGPMTDDEAEQLFQKTPEIEVTLSGEVNMDGFYAKNNVFGLSKDCPKDEETVWTDMYKQSNIAMHKLMKQPRRSLEKGVEELRRKNMNNDVRILGLNHFQEEDIREYTENQENEMVSVPTKDLYNIDCYEQAMEKADRAVRENIETRMTKKVTLILGITALALYFIGFVPVLFFNREILNVFLPTVITVGAVGLLALIGLIALLIYRKELVEKICEYNDVMGGIRDDVDKSMSLFQRYLTCAAAVMRGNSVLEEYRRNDDVFKKTIRILNGHIEQIQEKKSGLRECFGKYLEGFSAPITTDAFIYDFEKVTEYKYPISFEDGHEKKIEFIEDGNRIVVPYDVVEKITIRMEELYE